MASESAVTDSPGVRRGPPMATIGSQNPPAPRPSSNRPLESTSRLAAARASTAGGRSGRLSTFGEMRRVSVLAATHVISVHVSRKAFWYG